MIGIRQKLMLGFGGLLAIVAVIGVLTIVKIDNLGRAIDIILQENYRSVVACQDMKEALERMDSGVLFTFIGMDNEGRNLIEENTPLFQNALNVELGNITLSGEYEKADSIRTLFGEYERAITRVTDKSIPIEVRREAYFSTLFPIFQEIKTLAQAVLAMNQTSMSEENDAARRQAGLAHRSMLIAIVACALIAILFIFLIRRWILKPIDRLIESINEIRRGNLDLVLEPGSRDEIGQLSVAFNDMTEALRQVRKHDRINLLRIQRATEDIFRVLPSAVAIIDLQGRVDVATETASRHFGLKAGVFAQHLHYTWLNELLHRIEQEDQLAGNEAVGEYVQQFIDGREYFFQPTVKKIPSDRNYGEPVGFAIIIKDVTLVREQEELKGGVISTVSHQLKTPLTSLRMSIHLLLEEKVGSLNEKQLDLLMSARDDSDRLMEILVTLLDLNRIGSGKSPLNLVEASPQALLHGALEPFMVEAKDKGIKLSTTVADDLPDVRVDSTRIRHVFANLLSNALRFTGAGGTITVQAVEEPGYVRFSVQDTGKGIPPEHLDHLFEQFYQEPGQDEKSGVGLGLAIVKEIVQSHGGQVGVESEVGVGSTFHFTLPVSEGQTGSN